MGGEGRGSFDLVIDDAAVAHSPSKWTQLCGDGRIRPSVELSSTCGLGQW